MALSSSHLLSLTLASDEWRRTAACRDTDPDLFFPVGTTGPAIEQIESAKAVCRACDAQSLCLEYALATNQDSGIWGGTSEDERRQLRKQYQAARRSACSSPPATCRDHRLRTPSGTRSSTTVPGRPSSGSNMSIVPCRSEVTSARTIDSPSPFAVATENPSGSPTPSSTTRTISSRSSLPSTTRTRPGGRVAVLTRRVGVVDHVLEQLVQDHRHRRGHDRGEDPGIALDRELDHVVG